VASKNREVSRAVINYANACKDPSDAGRLAAARADLATAKVADYIERTLKDAPPISDEQRARLVRLLRAGGSGS
jgi:hypothetical protein